jgi:hypothetical protein
MNSILAFFVEVDVIAPLWDEDGTGALWFGRFEESDVS